MRIIFVLFVFLTSIGAVQAGEVSASSLLCKELAQPGRIAGAAYVPGVDVHGRKVVSADVGNDNQVISLRVVRIPVDLDLAQKFNLQLPAGVELKPTLGMLDISQDGTVSFDGREITQQAGAYCSHVSNQAAPFAPQTSPQTSGQSLNGQAGADRIISNSDTGVQGADIIHGQAN